MARLGRKYKAGEIIFQQGDAGNYFVPALEACEGCGNCVELCPCGYLEPRDTAAC